MKALYVLLIFIVVAIVAEFAGWNPLFIFVSSGLAMIPLAGLMGEATEALAVHTGPRLGGLLNATLGNAAELIITIMALREGLANPAINAHMLELVRASLTGSILGNILLVLGLAVLVGGLRNGLQRFDPRYAGMNATMLILAVAALVIPSLFSHSIEVVDHDAVEYLSLGVAGLMILLYALAMWYQLRDGRETSAAAEGPASATEEAPHWSVPVSAGVLGISTLGIVIMSELLVGTVEHVVLEIGISEFFLGIIIVPLIGNVAEHLVAVQVALKNKMELSLAISVGSSLQIALFVAPLLVFVSLFMGNPLTLVFNQFELIALMVAVLIAAMVSLDGESSWLEGAMLLTLYIIIALAFFWLPFQG
ncbi:MAG TPA: calcium/proton exchanger [Anaerolineae bacterium]|nr:calcium/proton exchanger [Anaerolineae bacterium]